LADYELVADLSAFYGQIDELRWRLRNRAETGTSAAESWTPRIPALAQSMQNALPELLMRVRQQEDMPAVEPTRVPSIHHFRLGVSALGGPDVLA
jgi:hypothetical protein